MTTIVTRAGKGSELTHNEVDSNFTNLNTDKLEGGAAKFWVSEAAAALSAEVNLGALTTGLLKHTVAAGVSTPATAVAGIDYESPGAVAAHASLQTGVHGISVTAGKTLSASNTLTLAGTDGSTLNVGTGGTLGTAAFTAVTAYAAASHAHSGSDISSGTVAATYLPSFGAAAAGIVPASGGGTANFLRADGTWAAPPGAGSVSWGGITGTLSSQTDLQSALDGKSATGHTHTGVYAPVTSGTSVLKGDGSGGTAAAVANTDFAAAAHEARHEPGGADALPWTTIHGRGTTAAKPAAAAGNAGFLYFDTTLGKMQRSTGSAWEDVSETGGGGGTWGSITGTLSSQTDLQSALDAKAPTTGHVSIATVGTIATGTWQGTAIAGAYQVAFAGDSGSGGVKGAVPAPAAGDATAGKYLKADGTWAVPTASAAWGSITGTLTAQTDLWSTAWVHAVTQTTTSGTLNGISATYTFSPAATSSAVMNGFNVIARTNNAGDTINYSGQTITAIVAAAKYYGNSGGGIGNVVGLDAYGSKDGTGSVGTAVIAIRAQVQNNATTALAWGKTVFVQSPVCNGSYTITNCIGIWVENQGPGGTSGSYGIYIADQTAGRYAFYTAGAGLVKISDTTDSSSTSTGALVVTGGAGFGGKVYAVSFYGSGAGLSSNTIPKASLVNMTAAGVLGAAAAGAVTELDGAAVNKLTAAPRLQDNNAPSSLTPDVDSYDVFVCRGLTGTLTINNHSGSPGHAQSMILRIKDNGTSRTLTWSGSYYRGIGITLPTATTAGKTLYLGFKWNATDTKWDCLAKAEET